MSRAAVIMAGLATAALLPAAPDSASHEKAPREKAVAESHRPSEPVKPATSRAARSDASVPKRGMLIICVRGVDTFVSAAGTGAVGGNLAFGVRDGECRRESVPGGRYLVRLQGGPSGKCSGAIASGSCEIGRPQFSYVEVALSKQAGLARFDAPKADVNVAHGATTKVSFVFRGPN